LENWKTAGGNRAACVALSQFGLVVATFVRRNFLSRGAQRIKAS
jgi:hypothetical protein